MANRSSNNFIAAMNSLPPENSDDSNIDKLLDLQKRAESLVAEFCAYSEFLRSKNQHDEVEMRMFRRGLEAELEGLEKAVLGKKKSRHGLNHLPCDEAAAKRERLLKTSNVPYYEFWWSLAKQCKGVRGLGRRIVLHGCDGARRSKGRRSNPQQGQEVQVDIMADDGHEWIKISTMSEKRLVYEMAKEGWERYGDYSDSDTDAENHNVLPKGSAEKPKLELLRLADALQAASQTVRSGYKHPRVRFVLPRVTEGKNSDVDALLADIRATGASVEAGSKDTSSIAPTSLETVFGRMLPTSHNPPLTQKLNIDCSILIAMISDQCHTPPSQLPDRPLTPNRTYHAAILAQMAEEEVEPLLTNTLYPLLSGRELTCTSEAAGRMLNIVSMMGTEPERQRAAIILGNPHYSSYSQSALHDALQSLSSYPLPTPPGTISLPIRTIDVPIPVPAVPSHPTSSSSISTTLASLTTLHPNFRHAPIFTRLLQTTKLSTLNAAVLLYGWSEDIVTLTSNQTAVNQVERGIGAVLDELERRQSQRERSADGGGGDGGGDGESRDGQDNDPMVGSGGEEKAGNVRKELEAFEPPLFWVVRGCRSLVGKEKEKKKGSEEVAVEGKEKGEQEREHG